MELLKKKSFILGAIVLVLGLLGSFYWWNGRVHDALYPYNPKKDRASLVQIFSQNWYFLDDRELNEGLKSFEEWLDKVDDPVLAARPDAMEWTVYRSDDGIARAFISYYMKQPDEKIGKILYLAVNEQYRKQGIARKLMTKAIDALIKKGAKVIEIVTRITNYPAQNLYKSLGFVQVGADETFVFLELRP
ncbi:TPA: hypothetical protein DDZ86_01920 [Candidatus Dependentiae bacterium]|nr:MAG: Ribosomal-protein-alanine acetyltransferase [candidate division TM6 bacterium GW2011_GWF2_43_87]HBL98382.1 hypothetical protein [Candidatus Dependentiae bacterium]